MSYFLFLVASLSYHEKARCVTAHMRKKKPSPRCARTEGEQSCERSHPFQAMFQDPPVSDQALALQLCQGAASTNKIRFPRPLISPAL